ncbi:MAG: hypothetical protein ACREFQ_18350, partial [Stellaceae bacterium]
AYLGLGAGGEQHQRRERDQDKFHPLLLPEWLPFSSRAALASRPASKETAARKDKESVRWRISPARWR